MRHLLALQLRLSSSTYVCVLSVSVCLTVSLCLFLPEPLHLSVHFYETTSDDNDRHCRLLLTPYTDGALNAPIFPPSTSWAKSVSEERRSGDGEGRGREGGRERGGGRDRPINVGKEISWKSESEIESDTVDGEQRALQDQAAQMDSLLGEFMSEISRRATSKRASISLERRE
jgi:hypothetical protein